MPIFRNPQTEPDPTPSPATGPSAFARLGAAAGLTQFGVVLQDLPPGSRTSIKHWHAAQDEFVYVLAGTPTLLEGDTAALMQPGDCATFKAGVPVGHTFENRSPAPVRLLVIGTRTAQETVTYPDIGVILAEDRAAGTFGWTDLAGNPHGDPYA